MLKQWLILKQPLAKNRAAYNTFVMVVNATTRRQAIDKAQEAEPEHFNNEGWPHRDKMFRDTRAIPLPVGVGIVL